MGSKGEEMVFVHIVKTKTKIHFLKKFIEKFPDKRHKITFIKPFTVEEIGELKNTEMIEDVEKLADEIIKNKNLKVIVW
jgi:NTP pyrophosphatase (non-canonical NTP hydrolase)